MDRIRQKANNADDVVDSPAMTYGSPDVKKKKRKNKRN